MESTALLPAGRDGTPGRRIGLFGGSFDPPHEGHLHAARAARAAFALDRVVFVPALRPPHKPGRRLASGALRAEMLRALIAEAGEADFGVSEIELARQGPSYTIDTVRALRGALGEDESARLFLVLGSDNLAGLPHWRSVEELLAAVTPIVVLRADAAEEVAAEIERLPLAEAQRAALRAGLVGLPPHPAAATDLRRALASRRRRASALRRLSPAVRAVVEREGLYGEGE